MYYLTFKITGIGYLCSKMYATKTEAKKSIKGLLGVKQIEDIRINEVPDFKNQKNSLVVGMLTDECKKEKENKK